MLNDVEKMTREQLEKASLIKKNIDETQSILYSIENSIRNRKCDLDRSSAGHYREWLEKKFAKFKFISKDRASTTIHYEFSTPIEFDVDEEFVNMVCAYFRKKLAEKEEELRNI